MSTKSPYVIGTRPSHVHEIDGEKLECNSPYCNELSAHPKDQEGQRDPWAKVRD